MNKVEILKIAFGDCKRQKDELLFFCPFCKHHKNKFSINTDTNKYKCWVCDVRGNNVRRLLKKYVPTSVLFEWDKLTGRLNITELDSIFDDDTKVEETLVKKYKEENPSDFNKLIFELMDSLNLEKQEGEKSTIFEQRLFLGLSKLLKIEL
jgi:hypothetical protein